MITSLTQFFEEYSKKCITCKIKLHLNKCKNIIICHQRIHFILYAFLIFRNVINNCVLHKIIFGILLTLERKNKNKYKKK